MMLAKALLAAAGMILSCGAAKAGGPAPEGIGGDFTLTGGLGLMNIEASRFVFDGSAKLSQLDWQSHHVTLFTLGGEQELQGDYLLKADLATAVGGNSGMVDYDWLHNGPTGMDDWTDRSLSPDTRLEYYLKSSLQIYKRMWADEDTSLRLGGGLRYTDLKWGAYGGSYVYSSNGGFRDLVGNFPDDARGISYRMQIPVAFASAAVSEAFGKLTLDADVKAGLAFAMANTDDHWMRSLRFNDSLDPSPMIAVDLMASYSVADNISLYMGGSVEKVFKSRGDLEAVDTTDGSTAGRFPNSAGSSYQAVNLTFGFKQQF